MRFLPAAASRPTIRLSGPAQPLVRLRLGVCTHSRDDGCSPVRPPRKRCPHSVVPFSPLLAPYTLRTRDATHPLACLARLPFKPALDRPIVKARWLKAVGVSAAPDRTCFTFNRSFTFASPARESIAFVDFRHCNPLRPPAGYGVHLVDVHRVVATGRGANHHAGLRRCQQTCQCSRTHRKQLNDGTDRGHGLQQGPGTWASSRLATAAIAIP